MRWFATRISGRNLIKFLKFFLGAKYNWNSLEKDSSFLRLKVRTLWIRKQKTVQTSRRISERLLPLSQCAQCKLSSKGLITRKPKGQCFTSENWLDAFSLDRSPSAKANCGSLWELSHATAECIRMYWIPWKTPSQFRQVLVMNENYWKFTFLKFWGGLWTVSTWHCSPHVAFSKKKQDSQDDSD